MPPNEFFSPANVLRLLGTSIAGDVMLVPRWCPGPVRRSSDVTGPSSLALTAEQRSSRASWAMRCGACGHCGGHCRGRWLIVHGQQHATMLSVNPAAEARGAPRAVVGAVTEHRWVHQ